MNCVQFTEYAFQMEYFSKLTLTDESAKVCLDIEHFMSLMNQSVFD